MRLFDDVKRDHMGPAGFAESDFTFLNRSARAEVNRIRKLLEQWFSQFPVNGKSQLMSRFRSKDNRQHIGAFFELYCFALGNHQGYDVEVHKSADLAKSTQPDFLFRLDGRPACYLESTLASGPNTRHAAQERLNQVYDALNRLVSPDFFIGVKIQAAAAYTPSASRMRLFLEKKLRTADYDTIIAGGPKSVPKWEWSDGKWKIVFSPFPKKQEARNKPGVRPIGSQIRVFPHVDSRTPLLNAVKSKARHYGNFECPYIIAVNAMDIFIDEIDIYDAFFGKEHLLMDVRTGQMTPNRAADGLWVGPEGPRNQRVSGVLFVSRLTPWDIATKTPTLWHNPWATSKFDGVWSGPQMLLDTETSRMEPKQGTPGWELLGLLPSWPSNR